MAQPVTHQDTQPPADTLAALQALYETHLAWPVDKNPRNGAPSEEWEPYHAANRARKALLAAMPDLFAALTRRAGGDAIPAGMTNQLDLYDLRRREVQALGAALSCRDWYMMEKAYNSLRDKLDNAGFTVSGPPATPKPPAGGDAGAVEEREAERIGLAVADLVERHLTSPAMIWGLPKLPDSWMTELRSILVASLERELAALALPAPVVEGEVQKLRDALRDLEAACDDLAANRSRETYHNMIHCDRATPYLEALDEARRNARATLSKGRSHG